MVYTFELNSNTIWIDNPYCIQGLGRSSGHTHGITLPSSVCLPRFLLSSDRPADLQSWYSDKREPGTSILVRLRAHLVLGRGSRGQHSGVVRRSLCRFSTLFILFAVRLSVSC